jgi:hypothetical protein
VLDKGKLMVTKTGNADLPMKHGQKALLTIDVWEHAYYIDFRNLRPKYIETFLTQPRELGLRARQPQGLTEATAARSCRYGSTRTTSSSEVAPAATFPSASSSKP